MKTMLRIAVPLLLLALLIALSARIASPAAAFAADAKHYVCPPCATPCDTLVFDAPGTCPTCGMALVEQGAAAAAAAQAPPAKKVAILIFNGAEIVDFTGPWEMFGAAGADVYTVAANKDPITTAMGMRVVPQYAFADAPQPDVLVVPGGGVRAASNDAATLAFVRDRTASATITLSVCNGAFILASAGLLDGLTATTTAGNITRLAAQYPKIHVVRDRRYVDNGKIVTAAGLSAGIDGALHVIERLYGQGPAEQVALGEEYDWRARAGFARAALADQQIPNLALDAPDTWHTLKTEGDTRAWQVVAEGRPAVAVPELMSHLEQQLAKASWTKTGSTGATPDSRTTAWRFTGNDGKPWTATIKLQRRSEADPVHAELAVARVR